MADESRFFSETLKRHRKIVRVGFLIPLLIIFGCSINAPPQNTTTNMNASQSKLEKTKISPIDGAEMVLIPAGEFDMGTDRSEIPGLVQWTKKWYPDAKESWFEDETPHHTVYVDAFYMDVHEVTNAQYRKFVQATGHKEPEGWSMDRVEINKVIFEFRFESWTDTNYNRDDQPVVCVSWEDAKAYAEWAGKRLPTEAEWEKAARGGLVGTKFPWGNADPDGTQCNFADKNAGFTWSDKSVNDGYRYTAPVGKYSPNGYGLYDMAGNVSEWCSDWYDEGYYANSPKQNPPGPSSGTCRVFRGGSRLDIPYSFRSSYRSSYAPNLKIDLVGFRCVGFR